MARTLLTPTTGSDAVELSRTLYRKKVLPLGSINYKGRKIDFDREYLTDLAESFRAQAFDQVPFQLADADNRHTLDPERYRGEVRGMEVGDDGLYALLDLTPEAAEMVRKNPKLGVSARIVEGYDRADGQKFGRAMHHVLGTLDPRITGLGAWEEVALANDDGAQVLDLTEATYEGDTMADDATDTKETPPAKPDPRRSRFLRWLRGEGPGPEAPDTPDTDTDGGDAAGSDEDVLTDEELAAILAEADAIAADAAQPEPAAAALSRPRDEPKAVELANAASALADEARLQVAKLQAELTEEKFRTVRDEYVRRGVPPALVELARPLLAVAQPVTVDLSNGVDEPRTVDASAIARQMLDSMTGYLELAVERGHAWVPEPSDKDKAADEHANALIEQYRQQYGIGV